MQNKPARQDDWRSRASLFLISQNISLLGSSVVSYAIVWHITIATSSGVWMMLSTVCAMVPQILISFFGGVLADRYNRKTLIMLSDGFIATATLGLVVAFMLGFDGLPLLLVVTAIRSAGAGIQTPAVSAIFPQLVPRDKLTKVQGINQTIGLLLMLLPPAIAGTILDTLGIVATFFVDVITAVIAIIVTSFIHVEKVERTKAPVSIWADMRDGLHYTLSKPYLRRIIICFAIMFFLVTPAAILSPLMVIRSFGGDVRELTASEMVWTFGSLVGGVFVTLKGEFKNKVLTVGLCLVAFGILFVLLGIAWDLLSYLIFMGIAGLFLPPISTAQTVHIQETTEPEVLGRVFSIVQIVTESAMPIAVLVFGPLADVVSIELLMIVSGILLLLLGIWYGWFGKASDGHGQVLPPSDAPAAMPS